MGSKNKIIRHLAKRSLKVFSSFVQFSDYAFRPSVIFLVINSRCNLHCKMCDVGQNESNSQFYKIMKRDKTELELPRLKELISEVKKFKPLIAITSTEPLLYKNLLQFSDYVIKKGLKLQITTNGFLLERFADDFVKIGLHKLWVSLDGPPEIHNYIRGHPKSFENAYRGIEKVELAKEKLHKNYPKIYINYAISNYNYDCLSKFMESIKNLPVKSITFSHMNYITEEMAKKHNKLFGNICRATASSVKDAYPRKVDAKILFQEIESVKKRYSDKIFVGPNLKNEDEIRIYYQKPEIFIAGDRCLTPWKVSQILANGDVVTMTRCFDVVLGNIYENSFREIWNGEKSRAWRKTLRKYKAFPTCSRCCGIFNK